jgi:hypothetical protein
MQLPMFRRKHRILIIFAGVLTIAATTQAEPLTFGNVQALWTEPGGQGVVVDLFATPGAVLRGEVVEIDHVARAVVTFDISLFGRLSPGGTDTLRLTYQVPNINEPSFRNVVQEFGISPGGVPATHVTGMDFPILYRPHPTSLTVDLLQNAPDFVIPSGPSAGEAVNSYTYTFSVVQPTPEPTSMLLLGSGLAALMLRRVRRSRTP